jgi:hypothetical protein
VSVKVEPTWLLQVSALSVKLKVVAVEVNVALSEQAGAVPLLPTFASMLKVMVLSVNVRIALPAVRSAHPAEVSFHVPTNDEVVVDVEVVEEELPPLLPQAANIKEETRNKQSAMLARTQYFLPPPTILIPTTFMTVPPSRKVNK